MKARKSLLVLGIVVASLSLNATHAAHVEPTSNYRAPAAEDNSDQLDDLELPDLFGSESSQNATVARSSSGPGLDIVSKTVPKNPKVQELLAKQRAEREAAASREVATEEEKVTTETKLPEEEAAKEEENKEEKATEEAKATEEVVKEDENKEEEKVQTYEERMAEIDAQTEAEKARLKAEHDARMAELDRQEREDAKTEEILDGLSGLTDKIVLPSEEEMKAKEEEALNATIDADKIDESTDVALEDDQTLPALAEEEVRAPIEVPGIVSIDAVRRDQERRQEEAARGETNPNQGRATQLILKHKDEEIENLNNKNDGLVRAFCQKEDELKDLKSIVAELQNTNKEILAKLDKKEETKSEEKVSEEKSNDNNNQNIIAQMMAMMTMFQQSQSVNMNDFLASQTQLLDKAFDTIRAVSEGSAQNFYGPSHMGIPYYYGSFTNPAVGQSTLGQRDLDYFFMREQLMRNQLQGDFGYESIFNNDRYNLMNQNVGSRFRDNPLLFDRGFRWQPTAA